MDIHNQKSIDRVLQNLLAQENLGRWSLVKKLGRCRWKIVCLDCGAVCLGQIPTNLLFTHKVFWSRAFSGYFQRNTTAKPRNATNHCRASESWLVNRSQLFHECTSTVALWALDGWCSCSLPTSILQFQYFLSPFSVRNLLFLFVSWMGCFFIFNLILRSA